MPSGGVRSFVQQVAVATIASSVSSLAMIVLGFGRSANLDATDLILLFVGVFAMVLCANYVRKYDLQAVTVLVTLVGTYGFTGVVIWVLSSSEAMGTAQLQGQLLLFGGLMALLAVPVSVWSSERLLTPGD